MIFALPAAIEAASLGIKLAIVGGIAAALIGSSFYAGMRWEEANTLKVQSKFDNYKNDFRVDEAIQEGKVNLDNQKLRYAKEISDEENSHARNSLVFYADRLRVMDEAAKSKTSVMPGLPATTSRPDLTCFDRGELDAADAGYRAEEAEFAREIHGIIEKGAEATIDLNSSKLWAQGLPNFPKPNPEVPQ